MDGDSNADTTGGSQAIGGESKSVYEVIVREIEDTVFLIDVEQTDDDYTFTFRRNNASHQEVTGLSEDELRGQTPRELLGDEQGATVAANYRRCAEQRETIQYEETLEFPSGRSHWQTKLTPITDGEQVTQIVGVARDITEQKEQQQKLQRLDRQFETVLETMSAAVFLKDVDGQYLLMNRACRELFNVDDEEIAGLTDDDLFPPEIAEKARKDDRQVIENGEMIELEEETPTATGNRVRLTRKSPVYAENGEIVGLCGVSTDITEQKQREREITRLKERFELAVEGANLGVWDWDMTTDKVEFNEQWARMLGHSLNEIETHLEEWEQRVHPDDLDAVEEALDEHIAGETELYDTEHRMRTADGDWKWIHDIGKIAERDEDGEPVRAVGIHLDIDDRKTYERQLAEEREMFTQGPAVVFKWREAEGWPIEYVSENVEEVLGYTADELQSGAVQFSEIIHEEDRERVIQEVADNSTEGTEQFSHEPYRIVTPDGAVRWVLDHTRNIWKDGGIINRLGYLVDITEQRQNEIYLQNAQKVADIGWWRKEIPSDEIYWSEHVYDMWEADGNIGYLDHERFLDFIHPEDTDRVDQAWQAALDGEPYDIEHRIVTGDGEVKWMREVAEFIRDETADPVEAVGIVQDITEQKERERELERQNERLEEFASIVSHDLRNPLNVAAGRLELAKMECDSEHLDEVDRAHDRMETLIDDLLTLAREGENVGEFESVSLDDLAGTCWQNVETSEATLAIEEPRTIRADSSRLAQLLENLMRNAIEHSGDDVAVTFGGLADGFYVEDTGPGIPEDDWENVFDTGYSTSKDGTGFGLSIVKEIADAHGWEIQVTDGSAGGARFEVTGVEFAE